MREIISEQEVAVQENSTRAHEHDMKSVLIARCCTRHYRMRAKVAETLSQPIPVQNMERTQDRAPTGAWPILDPED